MQLLFLRCLHTLIFVMFKNYSFYLDWSHWLKYWQLTDPPNNCLPCTVESGVNPSCEQHTPQTLHSLSYLTPETTSSLKLFSDLVSRALSYSVCGYGIMYYGYFLDCISAPSYIMSCAHSLVTGTQSVSTQIEEDKLWTYILKLKIWTCIWQTIMTNPVSNEPNRYCMQYSSPEPAVICIPCRALGRGTTSWLDTQRYICWDGEFGDICRSIWICSCIRMCVLFLYSSFWSFRL